MPDSECRRPVGLHKIALAALFTVGNTLIRFPWRVGGAEMPVLFLLFAAGTLIPAVLFYPLLRRLFRAALSRRRGRLLRAVALSVLLSLWRETLLPLVLLSAYFALVLPRRGERALVIGTAAGCGILALCVLQTLLTFGPALAARYAYPYAWAVRIISVGPYFFRLEGFSYLPDYLACLTRSALSLAVIRRLWGRFFPRKTRAVRPALFITLSLILLFLLYH